MSDLSKGFCLQGPGISYMQKKGDIRVESARARTEK
jgi:hypothetical protein